MKTNIIALTVFCSSVVALCIGAPVKAEMGQNSIGPSISIGGGTTTFGVDSKFGVADNLSLRPFVYFPSGSTDFGAALTRKMGYKPRPSRTASYF